MQPEIRSNIRPEPEHQVLLIQLRRGGEKLHAFVRFSVTNEPCADPDDEVLRIAVHRVVQVHPDAGGWRAGEELALTPAEELRLYGELGRMSFGQRPDGEELH
jgi:hypothetical protein